MATVLDMAPDRPDLGSLLHRLTVAVAQRELPLLHAHQLQMWDYVVLGGLEHDSAPTQAQLAAAVGRDKTRLITILDRLETRGLLSRTPDPDDRRNRIVTLTEAGATLLKSAAAISARWKPVCSAASMQPTGPLLSARYRSSLRRPERTPARVLGRSVTGHGV